MKYGLCVYIRRNPRSKRVWSLISVNTHVSVMHIYVGVELMDITSYKLYNNVNI